VSNNNGWNLFKWVLVILSASIFGSAWFYGGLVYVYAAIGAVVPVGVYLSVGVAIERAQPKKIWLQNLLSWLAASLALLLVLWAFYFYGDYVMPEGAYIVGGRGSGNARAQAEGGSVSVLIALLYLAIGLIWGGIKLSDLFSALRQKLRKTKVVPKQGLPR
jgi:hypothetical protein